MRFADWRGQGLAELGCGSWIKLYSRVATETEEVSLYSALVNLADLDSATENADWDLLVGDGYPGCEVNGFNDGQQEVRYRRVCSTLSPPDR